MNNQQTNFSPAAKTVLVESPILRILSNVQFVYELHLANLEVQSLAPKSFLLDDFRSFRISDDTDAEKIIKQSAYIGDVNGVQTDYCRLTKKNVTRAFNQYVTHWFYPYKGKFHPQLVRGLANIMGLEKGQTLLDPFVGSGTTAVEGALLGLKTFGFDISPLCVLIGKVKANAVHHLEAIEHRFESSLSQSENGKLSEPIEDILKDATRSFELLAQMIATSDSARRGRNFDAKLTENRYKMLRSLQLMKEGCEDVGVDLVPADIRIGDARKLPLENETIDGVITSPPYSIALNYVENDAHSLEALGYDLSHIKEDFIGVRGSGMKKFDLYEDDMEKVYGEIARVLRPAGKAAVVLGNMTFAGEEIKTVENCIKHCENHGLRLVNRIDKIIYGLYNVMQREWILIFEKHDA
jgi:hypothetical protein